MPWSPPTVSASFRLDKFTDVTSQQDDLVRAVDVLLAMAPGDALLEYQSQNIWLLHRSTCRSPARRALLTTHFLLKLVTHPISALLATDQTGRRTSRQRPSTWTWACRVVLRRPIHGPRPFRWLDRQRDGRAKLCPGQRERLTDLDIEAPAGQQAGHRKASAPDEPTRPRVRTGVACAEHSAPVRHRTV
ncbi:SitI3 family protein [Streptomyces sp. NBC_01497]|uniref:SitI3 family protein n=1 Tax=Streptomyces sp. NBC_01497 TaxID=2903885 RepID=UPI003FCCC253